MDIDDLVTIITYLDENKLFDPLPIFAAVDTDKIPSARLLEGDMAALLSKLDKIEQRCSMM